MNRLGAAAVALALLAGCGREASVPSAQGHAAGSETLRSGAIAMHATAVQTDKLPEQIVRRYGAQRDARTVLLVLSLRLGEDADAKALTAQRVEATVTDLLGRKQTLAMREVRDGELVDYVGTAQLTPPDTLRFEVAMSGEQGRHVMKFNRDFF